MKDFAGGTAIVTGGAGGIGFALAKRFGQEGMRVLLLDIEADALEPAVEELRGYQIDARAQRCDVADAAILQNSIAAAADEMGPVQVLCNNAGVAAGGLLEEVPLADWDWIVGVNLMSVVYGCRAVLPHMRAHGRPSWIVNTASMAGMLGLPGMAPYCATKSAVVAISESLRQELAETNIGVSALCPGWVRTQIHDSRRNHPAPDTAAAPTRDPGRAEMVRQFIDNGMEPDQLAERVLEAIAANELYIFTHPEMGNLIEERGRAIGTALRAAETSPALSRQAARQDP